MLFLLLCELLKNWKYFFESYGDTKCAYIFFTLEVDLISKHLDTWKDFAFWCLYHWDLYCIVLTDCVWKCLHASVYGLYSVKFAYIERENFFFMCILNLFFKFGLYLFSFPHLLNFSWNLFCFFYIFIGRHSCLYNLCCL